MDEARTNASDSCRGIDRKSHPPSDHFCASRSNVVDLRPGLDWQRLIAATENSM